MTKKKKKKKKRKRKQMNRKKNYQIFDESQKVKCVEILCLQKMKKAEN